MPNNISLKPSDLPGNMKLSDYLEAATKAKAREANQSIDPSLVSAQQAPIAAFVDDRSPWEQSQFGSSVNSGLSALSKFFSPDETAIQDRKNKALLASGYTPDQLGLSTLSSEPKVESGTQENNPLQSTGTPAQIPEQKEAPPVTKKAPIAQVKESFQATQSPEQKSVAQATADAQNPLVDTEMQKALEEAKLNRETNARRSALSEIMAGMGSLGGNKVMTAESQALNNAIKMQNAPVEDVNIQRDQYKKFLSNKEELEKADPNSSVSKTMRDALSGMGVKIPANASYATMEKLAPQLMKNKEFQMKLEEMKLKRAELGIAKQAAAGSKADLLASKDAEAFRKAYDPQLASSRSVLGKEASRYVQSQHAMNLIKDVGDLAKITPMQKRELAVALATMLSPGIPHESTIHALDEKTLNSELASMVQKVTGSPASTNTAGLTKQLKTSVANQQKVSAANIKKSQEAIKATFGRQIASNPELYNQVMKSIDLTSDDVKPSEHQNKPKTVIQNGHTYTLNEATGEYE